MITHVGIAVRAEVIPDLVPDALHPSIQATQSVEDGIPTGTVGTSDGFTLSIYITRVEGGA
jgi:hypothetical protein